MFYQVFARFQVSPSPIFRIEVKVEAARSSETSTANHHTAQHNIP